MLFAFAGCCLRLPLILSALAPSLSPVAAHGALHIAGARVVDEHGNPVALSGCSLFWSQWQGRFWNAGCVEWLARDWRASVVRAPLGIEGGGFLEHPAAEEAKLERVISAAQAAGIYVIIDWHDHAADRHADAAAAFFGRMAARYRSSPNVIFEIFNEPKGISWSRRIKPYAVRILRAIRTAGAANLVIVGTPHWSQDVDVAAADPLADRNVAYTLHFYAATHREALRIKAEKAISDGLPLFITEWGPCEADGDGPIDRASTAAWFDLARRHDLSTCAWAVSGKDETASLLRRTAASTGGWRDADLTPAGRLARTLIRTAAGQP